MPSHFKRSLQPAARHDFTPFSSIAPFVTGLTDGSVKITWIGVYQPTFNGVSGFIILFTACWYTKAAHFATNCMYVVRMILATNSRVLYEVTAMCVHKIVKSDCQLLHICPSVCVEQLGSRWTDLHEIWYLGDFLENLPTKVAAH